MFRPEAVDARRATVLGEILLSQGVSTRALTFFFATIAISIIAFMALVTVTRKAVVTGVLAPAAGLIRVRPLQAGVVILSRVAEGQFVHAGDELVVLSSDRSSPDSGESRQAISALIEVRRKSLLVDQQQLREQTKEKLRAARQRSRDLQVEQGRVEHQIAVQTRRVQLAEEILARFHHLKESNFVSSAHIDTHRADVIDQQQRVADLERVKAGVARDILAANSMVRDLELQMVRDAESTKRAESTLAQDLTENEAQRSISIRAPGDGILASLNVTVGQAVQQNQPIASIVPADSPLQGELYVPSRSIGFLKPGMPVLMRYEAYPYQKFGQFRGSILEISRATLRTEELGSGLGSVKETEPVYRVKVALGDQIVRAYGGEQPLRTGMLMEASILIENRRIYQWVLDPLYSIAGRL